MAKPDDWTLATSSRDGYPMFLRIANAYLGLGGVPGYEDRIIVGAQLREPRASGLPGDSEGDDLKAFELTLCKELEQENESLCALVITNQGFRDFIFYSRNANAAERKLLMAKSDLQSHKFQVSVERDADWQLYSVFTRGITPQVSPESA
jgi:hypothetical protein